MNNNESYYVIGGLWDSQRLVHVVAVALISILFRIELAIRS